MANSSFEWEGHSRKPKTTDRMIVYIIWFVTLALIVSVGVLINKKIEKNEQAKQILFSAHYREETVKTPEKKQDRPDLKTPEKTVAEKTEDFGDLKKPYSLRILESFDSFRHANQRALEFESKNFIVQIVPDESKYFLELESFKEEKDVLALKETLQTGNIQSKIVSRSTNGLNPQRDLEDEIIKLKENLKTEKTAEVAAQADVKTTEELKTTKEVVLAGESSRPGKTSEAVVGKPAREMTAEKKETALEKVASPSKSADKIGSDNEKAIEKSVKHTETLESSILAKTVETFVNSVLIDKPTAAETPVSGYTLQAGAYSDKIGAEKLRDFLNGREGQNAFIQVRGRLFKVCLGQFMSYDQAKTFSQKLDSISFEGSLLGFFVLKISQP
ncbi:MAG: SPOR domain-containing protein [Candidatus Wallbacteria bacterium]|nr:SPOR domain-containing protein [Candidatus Wallbacteria bacterium]